jgi:hypothetical protein
VRDWRTESFYASNVQPSLDVHTDDGPIVNDWWEKTPLSVEDLKRIKPFLEWIKVFKQQSLTGFGIMDSYLYHRVQPLKARKRYGFEYAHPRWFLCGS